MTLSMFSTSTSFSKEETDRQTHIQSSQQATRENWNSVSSCFMVGNFWAAAYKVMGHLKPLPVSATSVAFHLYWSSVSVQGPAPRSAHLLCQPGNWIWNPARQTGSTSTNGDPLITPTVWRLCILFFLFLNYHLKWFSDSIINFSGVLGLRRLVWKFWPKYRDYFQAASTHSQGGSARSSLQCSSSCYFCPTGIKVLWFPLCWLGAFPSAQVSQRKKKKLTELYRNITFFPGVEAKQTEV